MEKNFLLTYRDEATGVYTFNWFETEEQMQQFVKDSDIIQICDSMEVKVIRDDIVVNEGDVF